MIQWSELEWNADKFVARDGKVVTFTTARIDPEELLPEVDNQYQQWDVVRVEIERFAKNTKLSFTAWRDMGETDYETMLPDFYEQRIVWQRLPNDEAARRGDQLLNEFAVAIENWLERQNSVSA